MSAPSALAVLLLTAPLSVFAAPADSCTVGNLTRECAFFKSRPELMIRLNDGTTFRNPTVLTRIDASFAPTAKGEAEQNEKTLRARIRVIRAFDPLTKDSRVSDAFRLSLETQLGNIVLGEAFGEKTANVTTPAFLNPTPQLAWPPTDAEAKPRKVSREELADFVKKLPGEVKTEVALAIREFRAATTALAAATATETATAAKETNPPVAPAPSAERLAKLQELAEFARQTLLEQIQGNRDPSQLSSEEKSQLEKIRTLRVRPPSEVANQLSCAGVEPDAVNNPITHTLALCPSFANYPDSQLVFLFAHEMSHSIDPCLMQFPLLKINREKLIAIAPSQIPNEIKADPDRLQIFSQLKSLPQGTELSNFEALFVLNNPSSLKYFIDKGFVAEAAPAISFEKSPSWAAYSCLKSRGDFRENRPADLTAFAALYAESVNASSASDLDRAKIRRDLETSMSRYPQCAPTLSGGSQMKEVMADAWGAKVLGRWLQAHPPKDETEKIAAISTFAEDTCSLNQNNLQFNTGVKPNELARVVDAFPKDYHPLPRQRLNSIILTEPRIQAAFACRPVASAPSCLALLGAGPSLIQKPNSLRSNGVVQ